MDSETEVQGGSSQIFCLTWVKRKAAKSVPDQIALSALELKDVIDNQRRESEGSQSDTSLSNNSDTNAEDRKVENSDDVSVTMEEDDLKEFDLENYDNENDDLHDDGMAGLVVFSSNDDDPYITQNNEDKSDEEEQDALCLNENDNMLVCARCERDFASLDVHVYNEVKKEFYVHHDIPLTSIPLCMEWLDYDAGNVLEECNSDKGNFVAIGNIDSVIDVWDLDVLNTLEPAYSLGATKERQSKSCSVGKSKYGHTEPVLGLSWNPQVRNKLASASADRTVALWDLERGEVDRFYKGHKEKDGCTAYNSGGWFELSKHVWCLILWIDPEIYVGGDFDLNTFHVQAVAWKPDSVQCLLSGAFDGRILALDIRSRASSSEHLKWRVEGEIENVCWNPTETNYFAASTDKGIIYYCDMRKPSASLYSFKAHDDAIPGLVMTSTALMSASSDGFVKVWEASHSSARLLEERDMKMGMVHCLHVNPDKTTLLAVGGQQDGIKLWNVKADTPSTIKGDADNLQFDSEVEKGRQAEKLGEAMIAPTNGRKKKTRKNVIAEPKEKISSKVIPEKTAVEKKVREKADNEVAGKRKKKAKKVDLKKEQHSDLCKIKKETDDKTAKPKHKKTIHSEISIEDSILQTDVANCAEETKKTVKVKESSSNNARKKRKRKRAKSKISLGFSGENAKITKRKRLFPKQRKKVLRKVLQK